MRLACPICQKVIADAAEDHPTRPFCSARCKLLDLDNWLNERYGVPEPPASNDPNQDDSLN
ncbi:MAG TPA: DNA gyrase inhibitor YacG [Polyangiaceae bacterium]|nr:DNA gyrase inhibitor YacG [Polyangiaceae bacterium]